MTAATTVEPALAIRNLSKQFPGQLALDSVSLDLFAGEVHGLIGENGSGKSTLIKCLAGYYEPEPGAEIVFGSEDITAEGGTRSRESGLAFVHQDLGLFPTLSVAENLAIGRGGYETGAIGAISWRKQRAAARRVLAEYGLQVSPDVQVQHLSLADQTLVAIARALSNTSGEGAVLVLDEPTASLPDAQAQRLFAHIRALTAKGVAVLYVSHRLEELFELTTRITVLRDGRKVDTFLTEDLTEPALVRLIVGGEPTALYPEQRAVVGLEPLLEVTGLSGKRVQGASFTLHPGEILGVAGLLGSGRSELGRLLFGAQKSSSGAIVLDGTALSLRTPRDAVDAGVCYVPEDRRAAGAVQSMTLGENLTLTSIGRLTRLGTVMRRRERRYARKLADEYGVKPPNIDRRISAFSGGNQQKAVLAKWLSGNPRLVILDEPVNGIDIGARADVYALVEQAAVAGSGVIMISSEIADLVQLCNRILVMRHGNLVADLRGPEKTHDNVMNWAFMGRAS